MDNDLEKRLKTAEAEVHLASVRLVVVKTEIWLEKAETAFDREWIATALVDLKAVERRAFSMYCKIL